MTIEIPTKACRVSFNRARGYPQVYLVCEEGTAQYVRRYHLTFMPWRSDPKQVVYKDFYCSNWREQAPAPVAELPDENVIDAFEHLYAQIGRPMRAYLEQVNEDTQRELSTAIKLAGL